MVGDSSFDLQMARNAGMDSVAVSYGAQSIEALKLFEPRLTIDRFSQLHDWLGQRA
ncbi:Phosphoglycolate phosphatase [compost metagenome]|jgi:phosphoglycolate phosphatase